MPLTTYEKMLQDAGYKNVRESFNLYDTVLMSPWVNTISNPPAGWFATFNAMSTANQISFFNVRNRSIGIPYNNQDTRDALPYVFLIDSIGIRFFGPQIATLSSLNSADAQEDQLTALWEHDLPQNTSITLRTNQDDRLKIASLMAPSGQGPAGGGVGRGDPSTYNATLPLTNAVGSQGMPELKNRWPFPYALGVPRRASLSVTLKLTEFAKELLGIPSGPGFIQTRNSAGNTGTLYPAFGIQVTIFGRREVQQRGQYHA